MEVQKDRYFPPTVLARLSRCVCVSVRLAFLLGGCIGLAVIHIACGKPEQSPRIATVFSDPRNSSDLILTDVTWSTKCERANVDLGSTSIPFYHTAVIISGTATNRSQLPIQEVRVRVMAEGDWPTRKKDYEHNLHIPHGTPLARDLKGWSDNARRSIDLQPGESRHFGVSNLISRSEKETKRFLTVDSVSVAVYGVGVQGTGASSRDD